MPFPVPPTTTLVLPTGATSGERLVLDGTTDTITAYRADNTVAWVIDPIGYHLMDATGLIEIISLDTSGVPKIILNSGTAGETDGSIVLDHVAAAGSIAPLLRFTTPENAGVAAILELIAGAGTIPRQFNLSVDQLAIDDGAGDTITWDGVTLATTSDLQAATLVGTVDVESPRGSVPRGENGTVTGAGNVGPFAATTTILSMTVAVVAGRSYRCHASWYGTSFTMLGDVAQFDIASPTMTKKTTGTLYVDAGNVGNNDGGNMACILTATATGNATINLQGVLQAGSGTITVLGSAGSPIALWLEDIGI